MCKGAQYFGGFSRSTLEATKQATKVAMGIQEITQYEKYLGLPSLIGRGGGKGEFQLHKRKSLVEVTGLGKEDFVSSTK